MGGLDRCMQTLIIPLLPDLPEILNVSADDASWLVTATLLAGAVATPIVSRMADMYGKRKMLLVSLPSPSQSPTRVVSPARP